MEASQAWLLRSHKVEIQIDNPHIEENPQDHFVCSIGFEAIAHVSTLDDLIQQDPKALEAAMGEYATTKTGPFVSVGVAFYAYLRVVEFCSEDGQRTLQILLDSLLSTGSQKVKWQRHNMPLQHRF